MLALNRARHAESYSSQATIHCKSFSCLDISYEGFQSVTELLLSSLQKDRAVWYHQCTPTTAFLFSHKDFGWLSGPSLSPQGLPCKDWRGTWWEFERHCSCTKHQSTIMPPSFFCPFSCRTPRCGSQPLRSSHEQQPYCSSGHPRHGGPGNSLTHIAKV